MTVPAASRSRVAPCLLSKLERETARVDDVCCWNRATRMSPCGSAMPVAPQLPPPIGCELIRATLPPRE